MLDLGTLKIGVEVDDGSAKEKLKDITETVEETGEEANSKLGAVTGKLKTLAGIVAAAAITQKVVDLGKQAVQAYAEFEQLEGGVKKIFGDGTAKIVQQNAEMAYRTAGISANKYMEQITSFSASLLQSLGGDTVKAAEIGDMAIRDMADNANTYGTSIESIQNAYQGFAKQNYTMLDNLKLGYGGTKTEMERLLADAEKLTGIHYDINNLSDVYEAIHAIQEETNITGTTTREAGKTIEGSVNAAKAAWQNLLRGFGGGGDLSILIPRFIESVGTVAKNVLPVALQAVTNIVTSVFTMIPSLFSSGSAGLITQILSWVASLPAAILPAITDCLTQLADSLNQDGGSKFASTAGDLLAKFVKGILDNLPKLIAAGIQLIISLAAGIIKAIPELVVAAKEAIEGFVKSIEESHPLVAKAVEIITAPFTLIVTGIQKAIEIWSTFKAAIKKVAKAVVNSKAVTDAKDALEKAKQKWDELKAALKKKLETLINSKPVQAAIDLVDSLKEKWESLKSIIGMKSSSLSLAAQSGSYRVGLREVPYDGYVAELHKGETVLTAAEVNQYRKFLDGMNSTKTGKQEVIQNNDNKKVYNLGDVTLDVSSLKDLPTIEDFIDMLVRAKQFA